MNYRKATLIARGDVLRFNCSGNFRTVAVAGSTKDEVCGDDSLTAIEEGMSSVCKQMDTPSIVCSRQKL